HLRVVIGAWSVCLIDLAVPIEGDPPQVEGKARTEEIPVAYVVSPEPRAVDQRPADIGPAAVVLRQRRDERPVLRGEHREIRRAIRRLRGLLVAFDRMWRELVQPLPVPVEPLDDA